MTTLSAATVVEDSVSDKTSNNDSRVDEDEILSSSRIKLRRATVAPTALPAVQLPRYLRDPGRNSNNRTRRQSMPVQYLSDGPIPRASQRLPSIQLATDKDAVDEKQEQIDKSSEVGTKYARALLKSPLKECRSFPLDNRLQLQEQDWNRSTVSNRSGNSSTREIDNSSETDLSSHLNSGFSPPKIAGFNKDAQTENGLEFIGFRSEIPKYLNLSPSPNSDKLRRHSIAVSVISDSNRIRGCDSPLPGMTDLGTFESSQYKSRDRTISVPGADEDLEACRKMGHYVPKPDNHVLLSLFSCICCCPLVGLVALIFSIQVDLKYEKGQKETSIVKSKSARCWALSAVAIGMMTILGGAMYAVVVLAVMPNRGSK